MSFEIKLQTNSSEKNRLTKSITDVITMSGTLKQESSVIDPVIMIEGNLNDVIGCNYATINAFGRKYFITNIESVRNNLIRISMHCDVLSTYAAQIRANTGIIKRQENRWNLYLNDGVLKTYQYADVVTQEFPSGFSHPELILIVAGS